MTPSRRLDGTWLVAGEIDGPVIVLAEPLSFWGGFDATTGRIIDRAHPQHDASLAGQVVAMAGSRGSSGTPGVLGDALRRGTGPAAIVVTKPDINLVAGAIAAESLYGLTCPILQVDDDVFNDLAALGRGAVVVAGQDPAHQRYGRNRESSAPTSPSPERGDHEA